MGTNNYCDEFKRDAVQQIRVLGYAAFPAQAGAVTGALHAARTLAFAEEELACPAKATALAAHGRRPPYPLGQTHPPPDHASQSVLGAA
jgi:hypothetical protein